MRVWKELIKYLIYFPVFFGIAFPVSIGEGVYVFHLLLIPLFLFFVVEFCIRVNFKMRVKLWFILILTWAGIEIIINKITIGVTNELVKAVYILLCSIVFNNVLSRYRVDHRFIFYAMTIGCFISSAKFIYDYNFANISTAYRLESNDLGGVNSFSVFVSIIIIYCTVEFFRLNNSIKYILIPLIVFFAIVSFSTFSRGGVVTLIAGWIAFVIFGSENPRKTILSCLFFFGSVLLLTSRFVPDYFIQLAFERYIFSADIADVSGSGRTELWIHSLNVIASRFENFLFGSQAGTFVYNLTGASHATNSIHNQYLEYFYNFGFFALCFMAYALYNIFIRICLIRTASLRGLYFSMFFAMSISLLLDSHLQTAQIGWVFVLIYSLMANAYKHEQN